METFAAVSETVTSDPSFVQYDVTGRIVKDIESYDTDPHAISDEFKRPEY